MTNFINTLPARWETFLRGRDRALLWISTHRMTVLIGFLLTAIAIGAAGLLSLSHYAEKQRVEKAKVEAAAKAKAKPAPKKTTVKELKKIAKPTPTPAADVEFPGRRSSQH